MECWGLNPGWSLCEVRYPLLSCSAVAPVPELYILSNTYLGLTASRTSASTTLLMSQWIKRNDIWGCSMSLSHLHPTLNFKLRFSTQLLNLTVISSTLQLCLPLQWIIHCLARHGHEIIKWEPCKWSQQKNLINLHTKHIYVTYREVAMAAMCVFFNCKHLAHLLKQKLWITFLRVHWDNIEHDRDWLFPSLAQISVSEPFLDFCLDIPGT